MAPVTNQRVLEMEGGWRGHQPCLPTHILQLAEIFKTTWEESVPTFGKLSQWLMNHLSPPLWPTSLCLASGNKYSYNLLHLYGTL